VSNAELSWILATTCRCLTEDLAFPPADCERPITELAGGHQVVAAFIKKRSDSQIGTEPPIRSLLRKEEVNPVPRLKPRTAHAIAAG
jgi:hypothetical protein